MDDHHGLKFASLNWTNVFLLILTLTGMLWGSRGLKSSRPSETTILPGETMCGQSVVARLWQDPFEAVERRTHGASGLCQGSCTAQPDLGEAQAICKIQELVLSLNDQERPLIVLGVMVTGDPYANGMEWRVRSRVALLSGLAAAGYASKDREHIGYFRIPSSELSPNSSRPCGISNLTCDDVMVPFEWFEADLLREKKLSSSQPHTILVLWLKEDHFVAEPLDRINSLWKKLTETTQPAPKAASGDMAVRQEQQETDRRGKLRLLLRQFHLLGPWGSTTLAAMCRDLCRATPSLADKERPVSAVNGEGPRLHIHCSSPTVSDRLLDGCKEEPFDCSVHTDYYVPRATVSTMFRRRNIEFTNLACTDSELIAELLDELKLRGIDPIGRQHRIALISEYDTFYGRSLPATFVGILQERIAGLSGRCASDLEQVVGCFTYLSGLDGKLASRADATPTDNKGGDKGESGDKRARLEELQRPEGNSQMDYIPRLAESLKQEDRKSNGKLKAIGILGSDVYDKLLLLQSLRPQFPTALFFTTDLDARFFHPQE